MRTAGYGGFDASGLPADTGAMPVTREASVPVQRHPPLWEQAYAVLEAQIIGHELAPGTRLVETELAARLGISRNPVREAIRALEQEGWVERRRTGMWVPQPDPAQATHLFEARELVEARTAALAAERRDPQHLQQLAQIVRSGQSAVRRQDVPAVVALNSQFHRLVTVAAGNPVLTGIHEHLDKRARWHFVTIAGRRATDSWAEHGEILAAIEAGRSDQAAALASAHVRRSAAALHAPS